MKYKLLVLGMTCIHCENNVKKILSMQNEIKNYSISHKDGVLEYESSEDQYELIDSAFKDSEYRVVKHNNNKFFTYFSYIIIISVFLVVSKRIYNNFDITTFSDSFTLISVLIFGVITSFHCVGMCGGIALSQTKLSSKKKNIINSLLYNSGRILTYTLIGSILGLIGNVFTLTNSMRSSMFFLIGIVMLLIGFNNLGIIKFNIKKLSIKLPAKLQNKSSFLVGIMNGFMPCGPLQTVQLLALSSGSPLKGASIMLFFGIGTLPLLFLFSNIGLLLKKQHYKHLVKASALLVIMMSMMIFNQGFNSLGTTFISEESDGLSLAIIEDGFQIVNVSVDPNYYIDNVKVKKDIPVKLVFDVESISGCTANVTVPKYDVDTDLAKGVPAEIIFTPTVAEKLKITCWMSMVSTYLTVEE